MSVSTALINYAASGKTGNNAWKEVVLDYTTDYNVESFKERCSTSIKEFKEKHSEADKAVIDNAVNGLRSAQSVVVGAVAHGISVTQADGSPEAKSALQAKIKEAKEEAKGATPAKKPASDKEKIIKAMGILMSVKEVDLTHIFTLLIEAENALP